MLSIIKRIMYEHTCMSVCLYSYRLLVLPNPVLYAESGEEKRRYLVYITDDKVYIYHHNVLLYIRYS